VWRRNCQRAAPHDNNCPGARDIFENELGKMPSTEVESNATYVDAARRK
jgi:hypothetical protein